MAAGSGAASGHGARGSTAALEASLDRRFQGVSNTMESIQGLSSWCIENKKHHSMIVRYWMKWLKKSDTNHRLNLFYLANDVIQNCKRKNAIVFRSTFAEVLPNAALLIKDGKVRKSVERIFTIWEERSVYPEEVITQFKIGLSKKEREKERQKEKEKEKEKEKKETPPPVQASSKTALKSKIVAEFTPTTFIEQLSAHKRTVEEEEFREKQLAALRLDVCSTEALKRMKDKAGGNKFANDFEDGSQKLQEFVTFLEDELNSGPSLLEALGNSDIFYEMQYKEVKIVANAYNAFANRVASLKRKLDVLKSSMPGPEDSPIPSPSEDAPSPTGSDSPYLGTGANRAQLDPELDGKAMDEGELVKDNRDSEDMDMSDEEVDRPSVTVDDDKDKATPAVSKATMAGTPSKLSLVATPPKASKAPAPTTPVTSTSATGQGTPSTPLGVNLANVDLGKISSILSSITSAMKNTAASPSARPSPGTPTTPSGQSAASKSAPTSPALASILSRVDITPEGILNALSKTHTPGFSSLLQSVTNSSSTPSNRSSPESSSSSSKTPLTPTTPKSKAAAPGSGVKRDTPGRTRSRENESQATSSSSPPPPSLPAPVPCPSGSSASPPSLESKINSFLQGNPAFSLGLGDGSPPGGTDGVDGTPVRDEAAGTPTQDEIMDTPSGGHSLSPTAYRGADPWDAVITPSGGGDDFLASSTRYGDEARKRSSAPTKHKEDAGRKQQAPAVSLGDGAAKMTKGKKDGQAGERRAKAGSKDAGPGRYHRIQTLVSPCVQGERIQTVESIRVTGRGSRPGAGGRPGGGMWYEEEEYMEAPPPSPRTAAPPPLGQAGPEDMLPSRAAPPPLPPPPHLLPPPHLHPPPPPPLSPFQMPYHGEGLQTPPPPHHHLHHHHPPPPASFFSAPPIPRPPPPPMPQRPLHPHGFPRVPSVVMVGGVLVPVDRPLPPIPLPVRPDGPRGGNVAPPPLMTSLLGEPPKLPRPGTVKEPFLPRHVLPLHRPGAPGAPPSLLGRVKEPLSRPPPSPSPTSSVASSSTPSSPAADAASRPPGPPQSPAASPPAQPRGHPVPLLRLPILPTPPVPQRPPLRGRAPKFSQDAGGFRGGKRPAPAFTGGPFHAPKRPFLPPRY